MFIRLTNEEGKHIYVNVEAITFIGPYDGERLGGTYANCRSVVLCRSFDERFHVQETAERVIELVQLSRDA